jgi:Tfp pilus assembly protein PilO
VNPFLANLMQLLRRYPHSAICLLLTIALGIGAYFLHSQIADLETTQRERAKEGEAMLALLVGGSAQRQELAAVHEVARRIEDNLVVEDALAENLWYFYKLEEQTKARLPELHQLSSPPGDTSPLYKRIPYTLRATGSFEQVASFLLALETGPRLVNIISFNCARTGAGGAGLALDLGIEVLGKK